MLFIVGLISIEILIFLVLKEHFYNSSRLKFNVSLFINFIFSIWIVYLFIRIKVFRGPFDMPENISNQMNLAGILSCIVFPGFLLIMFHYTGKLFRIRKKGYIKWMTGTGIAVSFLISAVIALGLLKGRYNVKTEEVTIRIKNLPPGLEGLRIVHISDMHLSSFYRHHLFLQKIMEEINSCQPDLIINTGDFISYGWREFDRCDTILSKAKSRYGNFAIIGNHDMGTYLPDTTRAARDTNAAKLNELIKSSGYRLLFDSNSTIGIRGIKVEFIGVSTSGRFPKIIHGDLKKAMEKPDTAEFKILLAHDSNQWDLDVVGKTDINLTFSGHTHGMQMGIITKKFRWSPIKYFYPHWNGLYSVDNQFLYVNRGLGVLGIPFRIWMPPEITMLILKSKQIN